MSTSRLSFTLNPPHSSSNTNDTPTTESKFGPRLGRLVLTRTPSGSEGETMIEMDTPALFTTTSRGVVPHISRDQYERLGEAMRWTSVPFESFLEHNPPVPVLYASSLSSPSSSSSSNSAKSSSTQPSPTNPLGPLHTFLGLPPTSILSMVPRDPTDTREMPTNANGELCVSTLRGVRRLTPATYTSHTHTLRPDIVTALTDTPYTPAPYSQKRISKSIERSAAWLAHLLAGSSVSGGAAGNVGSAGNGGTTASVPTTTTTTSGKPPFAILAPLAGLTSIPARRAFAASLLEPLDRGVYTSGLPGIPSVRVGRGEEGLECLDDGVDGYVVDLAPLLQNPQPTSPIPTSSTSPTSPTSPVPTSPTTSALITSLIQTSLSPLPTSKPRVITGVESPHDVLRLVGNVGVELVGAEWAQRCADVGVALDFRFPVPRARTSSSPPGTLTDQGRHQGKKVLQLGKNLYDPVYAMDFSSLAEAFRGARSEEEGEEEGRDVCWCGACSPVKPGRRLYHGVDTPQWSGEGTVEGGEKEETEYAEPFTRAYVHHLLHTHEMSAHTLLVMHNLAVVDAFFAGIRSVLASSPPYNSISAPSPSPTSPPKTTSWDDEVQRFLSTYSESWEVRCEAEKAWKDVDRARGRGRMAREREREREGAEVCKEEEVGVDA